MFKKHAIDYCKMGKRIKQECQASGYTHKEIAEKLGVTADTLKSIYSGSNRPSLEVLDELSAILNVPLDYLLTDSLENCSAAVDFMIDRVVERGSAQRRKTLVSYMHEFVNLYKKRSEL